MEIINVRGSRGRTYEKTSVFLSPETARTIGIGLIEDAKAAESYRIEMCDDPAKRQ